MSRYDIAIIGAGIAGASLAAELGSGIKVLLLEAEAQPGYHATGRSAAFWSETYGGPLIQPLTTASQDFLANPPASFSEHGFLARRGALHLGTEADHRLAEAMREEFAASRVGLETVEPSDIGTHLQGRKPGWDVALWEPDCCDIDVAGLHGAYLRAARKAGVDLVTGAAVERLGRKGTAWQIESRAGSFEADILVNAAGAWADDIAEMAGLRRLGIQPFRRTMVQLQVSPPAPARLPLVVGLDGRFYFKPEAGGRIWLSPHDEIPSDACDAAPEEIDVATAIARLEEVVDWKVERIEHKWAGLRSFAPDRLPVVGFAPESPGFFWLAGQGGFGIQTAPAVARMAAALIAGNGAELADIQSERYSPTRFE